MTSETGIDNRKTATRTDDRRTEKNKTRTDNRKTETRTDDRITKKNKDENR
jgi:hypothetical protein